MAYKVTFTALALLDDGKVGNVPQFTQTIYTDWDTDNIKTKIDLHYATTGKKYVALIDTIERVNGFCLPVQI